MGKTDLPEGTCCYLRFDGARAASMKRDLSWQLIYYRLEEIIVSEYKKKSHTVRWLLRNVTFK